LVRTHTKSGVQIHKDKVEEKHSNEDSHLGVEYKQPCRGVTK
jgi:hypothetical protein